jgi:hypothetical protein
MIGFAAVMEPEVGAATGAGYGEETSERLAQRKWLLRPGHDRTGR